MSNTTEIRRGRFADTPGIIDLLKLAHAQSRYEDFYLSEERIKLALTEMLVQPLEITGTPAYAVFVAERGGAVVGFLVGAAVPVYVGLDLTLVTDLQTIVRPGTPGMTSMRLLEALHEWGNTVPGAHINRHTFTDVVTEPSRFDHIMQKRGFRLSGLVYEQEIIQ